MLRVRADASLLTFNSKSLKATRQHACISGSHAHTHANTRTERADGRVSLTQLFVAFSQCE